MITAPKNDKRVYSKSGIRLAEKSREIGSMDTVATAGRKLSLKMITAIHENSGGATQGDDPEYVHRMRVAVRKLRFIIQLWGQFFDKNDIDPFKEELVWFGTILGEVRDTAILKQKFDELFSRVSFSKQFKIAVISNLRAREKKSDVQLSNALRSTRLKSLTYNIPRLFSDLSLQGKNNGLEKTVPHFFKKAIKKTYSITNKKFDLNELHKIRISFKQLRYLTEFFGTIYNNKLKDHENRYKLFQDILGKFCDDLVAERFVKKIKNRLEKNNNFTDGLKSDFDKLIRLQHADTKKQVERYQTESKQLDKDLKQLRELTRSV
jgi:CHAD domain-containing protein